MNELRFSNENGISKWWVLLSGLMLTGLGFYVYNSPALAILSITYYVGFVKVISGGAGIGFYFKNKREVQGKMLLPISIIDLLFGLFLLFSPIFKLSLIVMAPFYFGTWALVRGFTLAYSSYSKRKELSHWVFQCIIGVVYVLSGFFFFANPLISSIAMIGVIGMMLIIMGISTLLQFIFLLFKR